VDGPRSGARAWSLDRRRAPPPILTRTIHEA
jgi:hypothetical protein